MNTTMTTAIPSDTVWSMRIETSSNVAAATILFYDCILTFNNEATLIWPTKLNLVKVLFFLTRYMAFIDVTLVLFYQLAPGVSIATCQWAYTASGWFIIAGIIVAEIILVVRTWAIWGRKNYVAIALGIATTVFIMPCLIIEDIFLRSIEFSPVLDPRIPGCIVSSGNSIVAVEFILSIVFETFVLILTLIKGIQHFRISGSHSFLGILYRDGILFYIYILAISVTNLLVIVTTPRGLATTLALIQRVLHSCLSSRLLINLKRAGSRDPNISTIRSSGSTEFTYLRNFSIGTNARIHLRDTYALSIDSADVDIYHSHSESTRGFLPTVIDESFYSESGGSVISPRSSLAGVITYVVFLR
ncbi:hypothetical protein ABKN59_004733 [Abortiporus biennis]